MHHSHSPERHNRVGRLDVGRIIPAFGEIDGFEERLRHGGQWIGSGLLQPLFAVVSMCQGPKVWQQKHQTAEAFFSRDGGVGHHGGREDTIRVVIRVSGADERIEIVANDLSGLLVIQSRPLSLEFRFVERKLSRPGWGGGLSGRIVCRSAGAKTRRREQDDKSEDQREDSMCHVDAPYA